MQEIKSNKYGTGYYLNGQLHREDGPAVIMEVNQGKYNKYWYRHGKLHRNDGPAIECIYGTKKWYFYGKNYKEAEYNSIILCRWRYKVFL